MPVSANVVRSREAGLVGESIRRGIQWALDRMLSVWYGVVYDFIFQRFTPYQNLLKEVLERLRISVPSGVDLREIRVLEIGCGPGNFSLTLAEAGFSVLGIDPYQQLVELAREKRRAEHLTNLAFQHVDLATGNAVKDDSFDRIVNVHSLYVHPAPERLLQEAYRVLKPGGYAVFVNFTRRIWLGPAFRELRGRDGLGAALQSLLWVLPNSIFEAMRKPIGPHYWNEVEFAARLRAAGFTVMELRRTFFNGISLLAWTRKAPEEKGR